MITFLGSTSHLAST